MASRFFAARSSGSEDESSDEGPVVVQKPAAQVASRLVEKNVQFYDFISFWLYTLRRLCSVQYS